MFSIWFVIAIFVIIILANAVRVLQEYERGVIFRLGRLSGVKGPGLILLIPIVDRMHKVSLRVVTMDVPPQDIITKDNVSVSVNAVVYFRVMDAAKAVISVQDYLYATSQVAQTTLRSVLGEAELDQLLSARETINKDLQNIIDEETDPWGIKVSMVEIKHVDLPENMQRAMAKQAEAERERRAKVIHAQGEYEASEKLTDAAKVLDQTSSALQLRYLGTLTDMASEKKSTIIFPIPIDLINAFMNKGEKKS